MKERKEHILGRTHSLKQREGGRLGKERTPACPNLNALVHLKPVNTFSLLCLVFCFSLFSINCNILQAWA